MTARAARHQRFLAELKRRHVFRVIAVYGAVGFVLLQIMELMVPALLLPSWTYRLVAVLILAGFPIALILTWAFEMAPDGIRRTREAAPGEIESIVAEPIARRWPSGILALAGLALLVGGWWAGRRTIGIETAENPRTVPTELRLVREEEGANERPSIAVLPFVDMSPGRDQEYFSDGITEEILDVLARLRELKVAARTSAFAFKGKSLTAEQLGDTLGVTYLLEGSVRKAGERLRITAQLIDAGDGAHVWSRTYDRELDDVFAIQTEIAEAVARELRLSLGLDVQEHLRPTADLEAYDLYLAGRAAIRERGSGLREAVHLLEGAIARDSTWASAWAGLAEALELMTYYPASWDELPGEAGSRLRIVGRYQAAAEQAAKRALSLDPASASARIVLGSLYRNQRRWPASEREYVQALEIDPDNPEAHQQYSDMLASSGRVAEGVDAAERAVRLDAVPIRLIVRAKALWAVGRREDAVRSIDRGIALDPGGHVPHLTDHWYLFNMRLERYEAATRFGLPPGSGILAVTPAQHLALVSALERRDPALLPAGIGGEDYLMLVLWQSIGDRSRALAAAEGTLAEYPHHSLDWMWWPELDPLREEPRFRALLEQVNLAGVVPRRTSPRSS